LGIAVVGLVPESKNFLFANSGAEKMDSRHLFPPHPVLENVKIWRKIGVRVVPKVFGEKN
jgi:hypothetical protein